MASIEYNICDRCGKKMEYVGWTSRILNCFRNGKKIKIRRYFNGNPDGYSYTDCYYELCAKCTEELKDFLMHGKEAEN